MAIKENEQPTVLKGNLAESAANTFTSLEISVPRILGQRQLFDIDEIDIDVTIPSPALGANAVASTLVQLIISEITPTALLNVSDDRVLAFKELRTYANATDRLGTVISRGRQNWQTQTHANLVPDDKVWLVVESTTAAAVVTADVKIKGSMAKVSVEDFESLVLSRLG